MGGLSLELGLLAVTHPSSYSADPQPLSLSLSQLVLKQMMTGFSFFSRKFRKATLDLVA
ncbi:hypothetical protein RchiOBHm_Chr2g0157331 [Rosa chinensis]|uniref:Uncharacterized protein n=1 Tax=Rosa chinensis TaxID=74649 RepID=A0A2P6S1T2_ROSCH|nr:hypothetical protein RchiOBHm_Chr2g0157331 [Rosa chinensis]